MGHFGKRAIRIAWFGVAAPALVLNYFGQGALLIARPEAIENPFYLAYPAWALYPMVALATAATIIASQATISGAYSMTQQAIQLGYLPRMTIRHTSARTIGQIYVPAVNWILLVVVVGRRRRLRQLVAARLGVRRRGDGHDASRRRGGVWPARSALRRRPHRATPDLRRAAGRALRTGQARSRQPPDDRVRRHGSSSSHQGSMPSRRAERARWRPARSRRSRLTSIGSAASASGRSISALSTW